MCGIIGFVAKKLQQLNINILLKELDKRGPDSFGVFIQDNVFIGHRRLSVMDTSVFSDQPMHFKQYVISFNGAIYNYRELRKELEEKGYSFVSDGDTEVILKAFDFWGKDCIKKFNGMFAFTIWDRVEEKLFAARDRLGIKPFYYLKDNTGFKFASNIKALLKFGDIDTTINKKALHHYMTFHSIVPAPDTILNGIKKLPQACTLEYDLKNDNLTVHEPYWQLEYNIDTKSSYQELTERLHIELENAIKRRLVAEVDVGVLLSGGLDSSLLTGLIHKFKPDLKTYSIGFESTNEELGDEFRYSDIIVNRFKTDHHKIVIEKTRMLKVLPDVINAMSEPMISHDAVGFYLLSQEVSRAIKVVQSGQGADEVFAGYHWYPKVAEMKSDFVTAYRELFFDRTHEEFEELINPDFVEKDYSSQFIENYFQNLNIEKNIDKSLHIDTNIMLVDDPVKRVDNMTMSWGLEARVPFLDHKLVEFAATIPSEYKYRDGGKGILKDVARKEIPHEVIDRPKGYFPVPALKYIRGEYLDFIRETLDSYTCRKRGIYNRAYINKMINSPTEYITKLRTNSLWQVAVLEMWLQANNI